MLVPDTELVDSDESVLSDSYVDEVIESVWGDCEHNKDVVQTHEHVVCAEMTDAEIDALVMCNIDADTTTNTHNGTNTSTDTINININTNTNSDSDSGADMDIDTNSDNETNSESIRGVECWSKHNKYLATQAVDKYGMDEDSSESSGEECDELCGSFIDDGDDGGREIGSVYAASLSSQCPSGFSASRGSVRIGHMYGGRLDILLGRRSKGL